MPRPCAAPITRRCSSSGRISRRMIDDAADGDSARVPHVSNHGRSVAMTDSAHDADRALYERWRKNRPAEAVTPDALALARYAEFGLDEDEADAVELALATDLALFDDVIAARRRSDRSEERRVGKSVDL